jgi:ABC-type nitrate/sulfonate/bicarbonate transport system ATPase subunit
LLHILAGLDWPSSGMVAWPGLGRSGDAGPQGIAVVFQSASLLPMLTVLENTALPLLIANDEAHAESAAREALMRFSLGDLAENLPEQLSGGQAQRVAIARATSARPRLLLRTSRPDSSTTRPRSPSSVNSTPRQRLTPRLLSRRTTTRWRAE